MFNTITSIFAAFVGFLVVVIVISLLLAFPVMLLWNGCLVPAVAGVNEVTWLQTWGLMVLFGILFKSTTKSK